MGEDPRQIRREIEETRGRMTETVEAIGYRADVETLSPIGQRRSVLHHASFTGTVTTDHALGQTAAPDVKPAVQGCDASGSSIAVDHRR